MSFQPFVLGAGLVAWRNLQRTLPAQLDAFAAAPQQKRRVDHFQAAAPELKSAEDLVSDRQSLAVALGAYGLKEDLNNRYFIQRVLAEGATEPASLANRLADSRYAKLSDDLALDGLGQLVGILPNVSQDVSARYLEQEFASAVGEIAPALRFALSADAELQDIRAKDVSEDAKWYLVMGNPPLRAVFETALGLPSAFGQLDIEKQLDVFREKAQSAFGESEVDALAADDLREKVIDRYLLRDQAKLGASQNSGSIALQLLLG